MRRRSLHLLGLLSAAGCLICTGCVPDEAVRLYPDAKSQRILVGQGFDSDATTQEELANERLAQQVQTISKSQ